MEVVNDLLNINNDDDDDDNDDRSRKFSTDKTKSRSHSTALETAEVLDAEMKSYRITNVTVSDPKLHDTRFKINKYITYAVTTQPPLPGISHVRRRYSDFIWLRERLMKEWPGIFIPPLPPKQAFGRFEDDFVEKRGADLEEFMNRIVTVPYLMASECFQQFCAKHYDSMNDVKKEFEENKQLVDADNLLSKYKKLFPFALAEQLPDDSEQGILRLREFLQLSDSELTHVISCLAGYVKSREEGLTFLSDLGPAMCALEKAENEYAQRPDPPRVSVFENFTQWHAHSKEDKNTAKLLKHYEGELADIKSMLEIIDERMELKKECDKLQTRVEKYEAAATLSPKDQVKKENDANDLNSKSALLVAVDKVLLCYQMESLWKDKIEKFNDALNNFVKDQVEIGKLHIDLWKSVSDADFQA